MEIDYNITINALVVVSDYSILVFVLLACLLFVCCQFKLLHVMLSYS
jgi:hypothetical protein